MTDWDRSSVQEQEPGASFVYLELGFGCVGAFVAAFAFLVMTGVTSIGLVSFLDGQDPSMRDALTPFAVLAAMSAAGIGLTQWTWLLPGIAALFWRRRAFALGLAIGGVLLAMLNGTCFAMILSAG